MKNLVEWFLLISVSVVLITGCGSSSLEQESKFVNANELTYIEIKDTAIKLFNDFAKSNSDRVEQGPCLGIIGNQWAIDIAHSPRLTVDNDPINQCPEFVNGKVKHLLEFSPRGQVITIK